MKQDQISRSDLEKAILTTARSIREDKNAECFSAESIEEFLKVWRQLVSYYERNNDSTIGVEVVREYLDWINRFSTAWHNERRSSDCREIASEAVEELELSMHDIIKAVEMRIYPAGR